MTKEEAIKYLQRLYPNGGNCWLDEQRIEAIGIAINALQEKPVSEDLNTESMIESYKQRLISQANGMKNSPLIDMCLASYKHGINETLDTLNLSNVQRTLKNWEKPKFKVGDRIKFKGIHNEDVIRVITDIKEGEGVGFRYFFADGSIYPIGDDGVELVEEPVSEELEEASKKYSSCIYLEEVLSDDDKEVLKERLINTFKAGAKWQEKQDQSIIELAEDHAMLAGMEKMKEEMMAKAIDAELYSDGMLTPLIKVNDKEKISDIKFGDKVKFIIIEENER